MAVPEYSLSNISLRNLKGVHPDLAAVVKEAITITRQDFRVIEGVRTPERQRELVARGASRTMNSRHLTGHAVDLAAWEKGKISWHWSDYYPIAQAMMRASRHLKIPIVWGGTWKTFPDGPHFELDRSHYA